MKDAPISVFDSAPPPYQGRNFLWRWWGRLSPSRQDRVATFGPIASIVLFLAANIFAFTYLRLEEQGREQDALMQDVEYAQQRLKMRLLEEQEQLIGLAMNYGNKIISDEEFVAQAQSLINRYPELYAINWYNENKKITNGYYSPAIINSLLYSNGEALRISPVNPANFESARKAHQSLYSDPILHGTLVINDSLQEKTSSIQLHIPSGHLDDFRGMLIAEYSIDGLLRYGLPNETRSKYSVALFSAKKDFLTGTLIQAPTEKTPLSWLQRLKRKPISQSAPLQPVGNSLILQAQSLPAKQSLMSNMLIWLVSSLSLLTAYMLFVNWRHTRLRAAAQRALQAETTFRRAMENSMPIGMRALDMAGKITYVNPAFCKITGWQEHELINRMPPYPYWPKGLEEQADPDLPSASSEEAAADLQYRFLRRDGNLFDARVHISPLLNENGEQKGWMTSLTDITEATQIRLQLSEAHDRFTAVLEAFDSAVSVVVPGEQTLLFANKSYRQWFGNSSRGHTMVREAFARETAPQQAPKKGEQEQPREEFEFYFEEQKRWFEVRSRQMTWTDGRPAQMLIAKDITARKQAEAVAAAHTEKAIASSHLVTMGEMASSVAHELNQPLTAINNYCNGMISRIRKQQIELPDLLIPLEKTAKQAERAGQIIHRVRAFVKRSAPNRSWAHAAALVDEARELFDIELRRRKTKFFTFFAAHLPQLYVDPILIEQVIVNLVRNAAEALDSAQIPEGLRKVELHVHLNATGDAIEFQVIDNGLGLAPEVEQHLFEAFYSTKQEGMGIGLNLCRSIIEAHGGELRARNLYNEAGNSIQGCCFHFTLPLQPSLQSDGSNESAPS